MSFPYSPTQNGDGHGWWPCPDPTGHRGVDGNGKTYTYNADTGAEGMLVYGTGRSQAGGWLNADEVVYAIGELSASVFARNMRTNGDRVLASGVNLSRCPSAGHGHWGCAYAGGNVYYDGRIIDGPVGYYNATDGSWMAVRGNDGMHIYRDGETWAVVPFAPSTTCETPSAWHEGIIGYGYNSTPQMLNAAAGDKTWTAIGVTPVGKHKESCPRFVRPSDGQLWVCTTSEDYGALLRPSGDRAVIVVPLPFVPNDCQVSWDGVQFIVTAWASNGSLILKAVALDSPRAVLVPDVENPPEPPVTTLYLKDTRSPNPVGPKYAKPVDADPVLPKLGWPLLMGSFYAMTFKYQPADDWAKNASDGVGAWLRAPGNCCVIAGEAAAALTAPYEHVICTPDVVFGGMADTPDQWKRIAGFYLAAESSPNGVAVMKSQRAAVRQACDTMGLACPPFFTYTPGRTPSLEMLEDSGQTAVGLELYANPGETAADLRALAARYRQMIPMGTPVVFYGMSYDRNGAYHDDLVPIALAAFDAVREWGARDAGSVEALLYFSDGRGSVAQNFGGARWHPELYPWLRAIAKAAER